MSGPRRDLIIAIAASAAGALSGAIIASALTSFILGRVEAGLWTTLVLLAGWLALSITAGVAAYIATAPITPIAFPIAFSVFVWTGVLVYPAIVVHEFFHVQPAPLVVVGACLAGFLSAVLVARIEPA